MVRRSLWRGWGVVLPFLPFVAVLLVNLSFYGGGTDRWGVLVPLWTLLLLFALAGALYALAVAGLTDATVWSATKRAGLLVVQRPGQAPRGRDRGFFVIAVGAALVVPLVMLVPALIAAVVNRVVLDGLGLPVLDPLAPTDERLVEEQRRAAASKFGPDPNIDFRHRRGQRPSVRAMALRWANSANHSTRKLRHVQRSCRGDSGSTIQARWRSAPCGQ